MGDVLNGGFGTDIADELRRTADMLDAGEIGSVVAVYLHNEQGVQVAIVSDDIVAMIGALDIAKHNIIQDFTSEVFDG